MYSEQGGDMHPWYNHNGIKVHQDCVYFFNFLNYFLNDFLIIYVLWLQHLHALLCSLFLPLSTRYF